jgi:hypothetical protein
MSKFFRIGGGILMAVLSLAFWADGDAPSAAVAICSAAIVSAIDDVIDAIERKG